MKIFAFVACCLMQLQLIASFDGVTPFIKNFVEEKKHENVIYSPVSAESALSLLYQGARGESCSEISNFLGYQNYSRIAIDERLRKTHRNQEVGNVTLNIATRFYTSRALSQNYTNTILDIYGLEPKTVAFNEATRISINNEVANLTNDKIKDLIESPFEPETVSVLLSAVYLKAQWQVPFNIKFTTKSKFYVSRTESVDVDMMRSDMNLYQYAELTELNAKAVELKFENSSLGMILVLPNEIDGLAALEKRLSNPEELGNMIQKYRDGKRLSPVIIRLPKFKIETTIDLKEELPKMGVKAIFGVSNDLAPMFSEPDNFVVSRAAHKAFIDVDENGIEAAASTYITVINRNLESVATSITFDHPFLFVVRGHDTAYFAGHVVNFN